jgi:16S rRNA (uracil1498-N3)-methyltransferase
LNLILLFPDDFVAGPEPVSDGDSRARKGRVRLTGRRLAHLREVHRAELGDEFCVGLLDDRIGRGRVCVLDDGKLEMDVVLDRDPPPPLPITLVLAMPRPLVLKRVLISVTTLGVKRIFLIQANRVERSFWNSSALREGEIDKPLHLGLEQARDTKMPELSLRTRFKPFVEDELPALIGNTRALFAHPDSDATCPRGVDEDVTLLVGPEGGWVPFEIEKLEACGCEGISLGDRILRVETALPVLLARLM